jgi:hypothetical protein
MVVRAHLLPVETPTASGIELAERMSARKAENAQRPRALGRTPDV